MVKFAIVKFFSFGVLFLFIGGIVRCLRSMSNGSFSVVRVSVDACGRYEYDITIRFGIIDAEENFVRKLLTYT